MELFQPWHIIILLAVSGFLSLFLYVIPLWLIAGKAGLPKWISLFAFIPFGGVIVMYYVAIIGWHPKQT